LHLSLLTQMNEPEQEELIKNEFDVESSSPLSPKSNSPTFSSNDRKTQEYQNIDILSVELGDVILIHAPRNRNIDQQSYYIYYIDDLKLKLLNTSTNQLLQLNIDGYVADESITQIDILSRSEVAGFARQHKLTPPQWIDVHFNGEVPVVISGEITNLEEDMIEITTYPGMRVIYIDFGYQGIPETLPIEKIVLREKPKSVATSLRSMLDGITEINREDAEAEPSVEFDEKDGQMIVNIPENAPANPSPGEIVEEYLQTDVEIPKSDEDEDDGELAALDMFFEVRESDRRYSEEIQVADLLGELVSKMPVDQRTPLAMKNIHKFVTRFKELRRVFSVFDENGDVIMPRKTSILHKPIIDHIVNLDRDIKWLLPVVYERNELMKLTDKKATDTYDNAPTHVETVMSEFLFNLMNAQSEFADKAQTETNKYDKMMTTIDTLCNPAATGPLDPPPEDIPIYLQNVDTKTTTEVLVSNDDKYQMDTSVPKKGLLHKSGKNTFTIRRYVTASSRLVLDETTRKRAYKRQSIGASDHANIRSIIMLPRAVLMQSQSKSPSSNLYMKSKLSEIPIYKHRILTPNANIVSRYIEDINEELQYEDAIPSLKMDENQVQQQEKGEPFLTQPIHYIIGNQMSENYPETEETFRQFLNAIIPRTRTLIRWMRPSIEHLYSFTDIVAALEPFFVESEDITFKQYIEIRYYIKEKIKKYIANIAGTRKTYDALKGISRKLKTPINRIQSVLSENADFDKYLMTTYNLLQNTEGESEDKPNPLKTTSSETLNNVLLIDGADAYSAILNLFLMEFLTIPESVVGILKPPTISSDDAKNVIKSKCDRRFIAKKYKSIAELRKDDNTPDVFYDKEYDDTPYHLLDKYKDERKRFKEEEQFREFFTETLIQKHDCPEFFAKTLADTIMAKKRRVKANEYAILEIKPTLATRLREDTEEERENEQEAETRKHIEFYRRRNDKWELDNTVSMDSFVDTNTLFCELSESCNKITDVNQCVPTELAALQMRLSKRARIIEEFDDRVARTFEEVAEELRAGLSQKRRQIRRKITLNRAKLHKQNAYSYELGKYAKSTDTVVESPHVNLRERILGWPDFVAKQTMIYNFVEKFCRESNPHIQEDAHWLYCIDTNTKLFPNSLFTLAAAFIYDDYSRQLDILIRDNGELSDDGDAIVDKYTGYVLRKIDYSAEEGFDESGFRITTNAIVEEKDIGTMVLETLGKKNKVFENPTAQSAYNVFRVLSENMGIQKETAEASIEEFVLRVSLEMMNDEGVVMAEAPYNEQLAQEATGQAKRKTARMPYSTYFNQLLIIIVSCSTFAAMQTLIPSFKTKKTFPGCVKSFAGFPLDPNTENAVGLKYIACVLDKSKRASELPWSAIEPLSVDNLLKRMKMIMQNYIYTRPDVQKLYDVKRDYIANYPDQDVPEDVAIQKWTHFLPPVVSFSIDANSVTGISEEYEKEFFKNIMQGTAEQFRTLGIIKGKLLKHGYLTYDIIDRIVRKKQMLLVGSGGSAFLENACCNERAGIRPFAYFQEERPELTQILQKSRKMEAVIDRVKNLNKAKTFFDPKSSRIVGAAIPDNIVSRTIYETFIHYCNFDNDADIPADLIPLAATKPEYNRFASLDEKIAFMKKHGKNYGVEDFHSIMRIVNSRNIVNRKPDKEIAALGGFKDMLNYFDDKNSTIVEERLRQLLRSTLSDYDPKVAVYEERANNRKLNRYLQRANDGMREVIVAFLDTHANLNLGNLDKMSSFLEDVSKWKLGDISSATREIYNMIYNVSKVYPNKTLARKFQNSIPDHWTFSLAHSVYLEEATKSFYSNIAAIGGDETDTTFSKYLSGVVANLTDLVLFIEQIPVFSPLIRDNLQYWSLYTEETVLLLYHYGFLSAIHEYVVLANDRSFIQMRAEEMKTTKRRRNQEENIDDESWMENLDADEDYGAATQIRQVHIVESDAVELKKTAAKWLHAVLQRELDTKTAFNRNYTEIMDSTMSLKHKDKKGITDYLAKLSRDERRVEQNLRSHKIGRWNVGMQKGLYQYEKTVYDNEIAQWHTEEGEVADAIRTALQSSGEGAGEGEEGLGEDVEDLEREERLRHSEEYDEGDGWENLNEEYMDGLYYEEDAERDD
jgi:hypothetical protein